MDTAAPVTAVPAPLRIVPEMVAALSGALLAAGAGALIPAVAGAVCAHALDGAATLNASRAATYSRPRK
jgi:hypothetical protein